MTQNLEPGYYEAQAEELGALSVDGDGIPSEAPISIEPQTDIREVRSAVKNAINEDGRLKLDSVSALLDRFFKLGQIRDEYMRAFTRWDLDRFLHDRHDLKSRSIESIFEKQKFTISGIDQLRNRLSKGEKWVPVFNPGSMSLSEAYMFLFRRFGFPEKRKKDPVNMDFLRDVRKINTDVVENEGFGKDVMSTRMAIASKHRRMHEPWEEPRIVFVKEEMDEGSPEQNLILAADGVRFCSPITHWLQMRLAFDKAFGFDKLHHKQYQGKMMGKAGRLLERLFCEDSADLPELLAARKDILGTQHYPRYALPSGLVLSTTVGFDNVPYLDINGIKPTAAVPTRRVLK